MSKNHLQSSTTTEPPKNSIKMLLISNKNFNKKEWGEHHDHIHRELQKAHGDHIKIMMYHPQISSKSKLREEFAIVVLHSCDKHLAKRYHRDIQASNEKTIFFSLEPKEQYRIEGVRVIDKIESIPFSEIN